MRISVCIPTYNQSAYLVRAVRSAFRQTLVPEEIIVSDDNSTDETALVLEQLMEEIPNLKVIRQQQNLGIAKNTDACLRMANGDFLVRLDSDDMLAPGYIEKLTNMLIKFPEAGYAHAAVQEIDEKGNVRRSRKLIRNSGYQDGNTALKAAAFGYRVTANIIMFRRTVLQKLNYVSERPNYVEDYHLSSAMAAAGYGNVYLSEVLSSYRVWVDAGKIRQKRKLLEISGLRRVFEEILEPAYRQRSWNNNLLQKQRTKFACSQADCLGWDVYNIEEKNLLRKELSKLSSKRIAQLYISLYMSGYGTILDLYKKSHSYSKTVIKEFFLKLHSS